MADNEIKLKIVIDNKEATASIKLTDESIIDLYKSFKYGRQEVSGLITSISQGFNNARQILQGFTEAYGVISQAFTTHLTAYQQQEDALVKLTTALKQTGQYTENNVNALKDYASQLQQITIYGDDVTETVMAQLLAMGLSVEQTKNATLQAANLATVMGTDLNTAARAMADLFNGNTGLIGRYVKGLDEAVIKSGDLDQIMKMLNERIGGQAIAMGQTATGQLARMNNAVGDLKENTGELLANALSPFLNLLSDLIGKINNFSPALSGSIGLIGTLTTTFITLRVTGIMPAITSINLFGTAITGLRLALIKSGIGALIVAFGYGLSELAKAYEHWQDVENKGKESYQKVFEQIRNDAVGLQKTQLDKLIIDAETQKTKLESDIAKLKTDIQKAKKEIITKDKEGYEFRNYYETEESKQLQQKLEQTKKQLQLEKDTIEIYKQLNAQKQDSLKTTDEELKKEFENKSKILTEKQRHENAILKIETDNKLIILLQKKQHLSELLSLYRKYGQDVTQIHNLIKETELEIKITAKPPEIEIPDKLPSEPEELPNVQFGNTLDYARLSKEEEINLWYRTELEKVKAYENSAEMIIALEEEKNRRLADLEKEREIQTLDAYSKTFAAVGGLFGKHTAAYKAMAVAQTMIETYKAATAALSPPPIGAGPLFGPILAAATVIAGMANVSKIVSTKVEGFAEGGRLPKGKAGIVEGWHDEIIAPEKTFVEIFRNELRPQVLGNSTVINYDLNGIKESINKLNNALEQGIIARAYLDDSEAKKIVSKGSYLNNKSKL